MAWKVNYSSQHIDLLVLTNYCVIVVSIVEYMLCIKLSEKISYHKYLLMIPINCMIHICIFFEYMHIV